MSCFRMLKNKPVRQNIVLFCLPGVTSSAELVDGIVKLDPELCRRRRLGKLPSSVSLSPSSDLTGVPEMVKKIFVKDQNREGDL